MKMNPSDEAILIIKQALLDYASKADPTKVYLRFKKSIDAELIVWASYPLDASMIRVGISDIRKYPVHGDKKDKTQSVKWSLMTPQEFNSQFEIISYVVNEKNRVIPYLFDVLRLHEFNFEYKGKPKTITYE